MAKRCFSYKNKKLGGMAGLMTYRLLESKVKVRTHWYMVKENEDFMRKQIVELFPSDFKNISRVMQKREDPYAQQVGIVFA